MSFSWGGGGVSPESFFAVLFNKIKVKSVHINQVELVLLGASFGAVALRY